MWLDGLDLPLLVASDAVGDVTLAIRPEHVQLQPAEPVEPAAVNTVTAAVLSEAYLGDHYRYVLELGTALGYTSLCFAQGAPDATIDRATAATATRAMSFFISVLSSVWSPGQWAPTVAGRACDRRRAVASEAIP